MDFSISELKTLLGSADAKLAELSGESKNNIDSSGLSVNDAIEAIIDDDESLLKHRREMRNVKEPEINFGELFDQESARTTELYRSIDAFHKNFETFLYELEICIKREKPLDAVVRDLNGLLSDSGKLKVEMTKHLNGFDKLRSLYY